MNVDLTPYEHKLIAGLLNTYLPGTVVWAFGSRVKFMSRANSDLDLIAFTKPGQQAELHALKEAFADSDLPFKVDLLEWDAIPQNFRDNIKSNFVVIS